MELFQGIITRPAGGPATGVNQRPRQRTSPLILIFLLDATGSMKPFIDGIKQALTHIVEILKSGAFNAILGMIVFRDEQEGELPQVYRLGSSPDELKSVLAGLKADGGGDVPESSFPAIMRALDLMEPCYRKVPKVFLHITDAPPHDPESGYTAEDVQNALLQHGVIFSCCTPDCEPYRTFANATGGTLFTIQENMDTQAFKVLLLNFAHTTVKTVRVTGFAVSSEVREAVRKAQEQE